MAHCVTYLALAPKSNALYMAYEKAKHDALNTIAEPVPLQIRNAPTRLMKELNYGKGYQYAHDFDDKITNMQCLPDSIKIIVIIFLQVRVQRLRLLKEWNKLHI